MYSQEELRAKMVENAAEMNRLQGRIHETVKWRSESDEAREEWSQACAEFHARYDELCFPWGPYPNFYERLAAGEHEIVEVALCFLEVRPYFFRSGYHWKTILKKCKRAPMSGKQTQRFKTVFQKYSEWKSLRQMSSKRGAAVRRDLSPLLLRFYGIFPVKLPDFKFDGLVTVKDLYVLLCESLKIEPTRPSEGYGVVREPCRAAPGPDMSAWAREYKAWRECPWTPEDVWATLVATIKDAYELGNSTEIVPETILRKPASE